MARKNQTKTEAPKTETKPETKTEAVTEEMNPLAEIAGVFLGTLLVGIGVGLVHAILDDSPKTFDTRPRTFDTSPTILKHDFTKESGKETRINVQ